jgi:hypothetical protein
MEALALVPADQLLSDHLGSSDLLIFGFLLGLIASSGDSLARARERGQPDFLIHTMPPEWARPASWSTLGGLVLKSEGPETLRVELGGQAAGREFITARFELRPGERREVAEDFFALTYLHVSRLPEGRIGVHSPALKYTYLAGPADWENIWVYGMEIILAGYLPAGEFRRRAHRLQPGTSVLQYPRTRTENMALPLQELRPLKFPLPFLRI